ncbi:hypothetical protein CYMTET_21526 [Cymbomonas tetramitiformis]|uniref:Tudor domain-containing protein n=1 Tax=Cymbomonas tetramitiformis TaxID=36881 RepID=A0AAE0G1S0_9CHLO|nr:hypothetical protein CYMTET_21526 [Cymbomonas tetramitiformis]
MKTYNVVYEVIELNGIAETLPISLLEANKDYAKAHPLGRNRDISCVRESGSSGTGAANSTIARTDRIQRFIATPTPTSPVILHQPLNRPDSKGRASADTQLFGKKFPSAIVEARAPPVPPYFDTAAGGSGAALSEQEVVPHARMAGFDEPGITGAVDALAELAAGAAAVIPRPVETLDGAAAGGAVKAPPDVVPPEDLRRGAPKWMPPFALMRPGRASANTTAPKQPAVGQTTIPKEVVPVAASLGAHRERPRRKPPNAVLCTGRNICDLAAPKAPASGQPATGEQPAPAAGQPATEEQPVPAAGQPATGEQPAPAAGQLVVHSTFERSAVDGAPRGMVTGDLTPAGIVAGVDERALRKRSTDKWLQAPSVSSVTFVKGAEVMVECGDLIGVLDMHTMEVNHGGSILSGLEFTARAGRLANAVGPGGWQGCCRVAQGGVPRGQWPSLLTWLYYALASELREVPPQGALASGACEGVEPEVVVLDGPPPVAAREGAAAALARDSCEEDMLEEGVLEAPVAAREGAAAALARDSCEEDILEEGVLEAPSGTVREGFVDAVASGSPQKEGALGRSSPGAANMEGSPASVGRAQAQVHGAAAASGRAISDRLIGRQVECMWDHHGVQRGVLKAYNAKHFSYVVRYEDGEEESVVLPDATIEVEGAPLNRPHSASATALVDLANSMPPAAVRSSSTDTRWQEFQSALVLADSVAQVAENLEWLEGEILILRPVAWYRKKRWEWQADLAELLAGQARDGKEKSRALKLRQLVEQLKAGVAADMVTQLWRLWKTEGLRGCKAAVEAFRKKTACHRDQESVQAAQGAPGVEAKKRKCVEADPGAETPGLCRTGIKHRGASEGPQGHKGNGFPCKRNGQFHGVHWHEESSTWQVHIQVLGQTVFCERFKDKGEAAQAHHRVFLQIIRDIGGGSLLGELESGDVTEGGAQAAACTATVAPRKPANHSKKRSPPPNSRHPKKKVFASKARFALLNSI